VEVLCGSVLKCGRERGMVVTGWMLHGECVMYVV